ncbi:radical SAM protein [Lachnospiraceae bacterium ZAX-1]
MSRLKVLKKIYDRLGNDHIRGIFLSLAEYLGVRKDVIRMDTNSHCNIRCIMCNQQNKGEPKNYMPLDNFKKVMDMFALTTRILYLSCAYEPLITPNFVEYLKYAKSKGIPFISFCTNALLLDSTVASCLVENEIDEIIISFNGFCEQDYRRIMDGSDFKRVCENIRCLCEYKKFKKTQIPHIRLNTILLQSNLKNFDSMYQFLMDYDIGSIQFRELMLMDGQNNPKEVEKELLSNLSEEEYRELSFKINNMAKQLDQSGIEVILPAEFKEPSVVAGNGDVAAREDLPSAGNGDVATREDLPSADKGDVLPMQGKNSIKKKLNFKKHTCSIPYFSYWINQAGDVRACGYNKNGAIGNALHQNFKSLNSKRKKFRKSALAGTCNCEHCTMNIDSSTII